MSKSIGNNVILYANQSSMTLEQLETQVQQTRRDILRMVHAVNSGHPGGSLCCTEFFVALYGKIMDYSTDFKMDGIGEDLFFLSNGHISPVLYSTLARSGFFPVEELKTFRKINSRLQGHPTTHDGLPGIRVASGSLGKGLSVGVGAEHSQQLKIIDKLVYTLYVYGELYKCDVWDAFMYASANNVENLIATIDYN